MIPILWRYTVLSYLRVFTLSVCTFMAVLIVSRFKDIAQFTALSSGLGETALFIVYQFPLILPMAIPISALIASLLLFQSLSRTQELTALRASGLSLPAILAPLLALSLLLSALNFFIAAEVSPFYFRESKTLLHKETSENPLLLVQRQRFVKIKNTYLNMKVKNEGKTAKDLILIAYSGSNQRLNLFSARQMNIEKEILRGRDLAIISYLNGDEESSFDPLIIENQALMSTAAPVLSAALKKHRPRLELNALSLRMLQVRVSQGGKQAKIARIEIFRRATLSLAVFSFTLLGCAFGIEEARNPSKKGIFISLFLVLILLLSYLLGKELKTYPFLVPPSLLLPHFLIGSLSFFKLRRLSKGDS
jgi:lipopolysaccharide export system permease protein